MSDPFMGATPSFVQTSNGAPPNSIAPIAYKGVRVITTERLAAEFGTTDVRIRQNHSKNPNRFVEGAHCFKVEGKGLADLRVALGDSQISPMARSVVLWTERGALAHAKILETEEAWQVYDRLVDTYFAVKEGLIAPPAKPAPRLRSQSPGGMFRDLQRTYQSTGLPLTDAANAANRAVLSLTGIDILAAGGIVLSGAPPAPPHDVPALAAPDHPNHLTVTDIGIEIGVRTGSAMAARSVNQALVKHGFQVKGATTTTPWLPTERGKPFAKFGDVPTKGESGRTINSLTWKWEVISELLAAMSAGNGEG